MSAMARVLGVGQVGPAPADPRSIPEMVWAAVGEALADAGIARESVDAVVTCSVDLYDGLTASSLAITEVIGAVLGPETRIAGDGLCAAIHAACQVSSGAYHTVLVVAHGKASMVAHPAVTTWALDPLWLQPLGVDFRTCAALQAAVLAGGDAGAPERWAGLAAARAQAAGRDTDAAGVLASGAIGGPLTAGREAPRADGAGAVLLSRDGDGPVFAAGGLDLDTHDLGARELSGWPGLGRAIARACEAAGLEAAVLGAAGFDLLEPSCHYAHEDELFRAVVRGSTCSPTGGLFAGDVPAAAGLTRLVAATRWLREHGGRALVHGTWGPAGQGQAVAILEAA